MPEFLTFIYLAYIFIALYFLFLFILIYIPNRNKIFSYPKYDKKLGLTMIVTCFNEGDSVGDSVGALLKSSYPIEKIIIVDDCSADNSYAVVKKLAAKYKKVMAVQTPKNTGKASGAKNYGAKLANTTLIGFTDGDSFPDKDAIEKMIGFFGDEKVAAVTSMVLVKRRKTFMEMLQSIEYKIIAFTRKLLGFVDAIYVTPGPLAIYRKSAFDKVGGFDESNMTEDIEITWHFVAEGYKVAMSASSKVYTVAPATFKPWFKQRIRWNVGGIQTINKYKSSFAKTGMLGSFILPFFVLSWLLGIVGIVILLYRVLRRVVVNYLATTYSVNSQAAILTLREINLAPSILFFFGIAIIILSLGFTGLALMHSREKEFKNHGIFSVLAYMFAYILAYPFILIVSVYKFATGKYSW